MRWIGLGWTLALVACTTDNPEFDGEVGPTPMRGTDDGGSVSATSPSSGLVTTDSAGTAGTSGASTGDDGVASSEGDDASDSGSGAPPAACEFEKVGFRIELTDAAGDIVAPDCDPRELVGVVTIRPDGSGLQIHVCENQCVCETQAQQFTVSFGEAGVVSDVYGGCRRIRLWAEPDDAAVLGCSAWSGFSLESTDGVRFVIGANTLSAEFPDADFSVQLGDGEECGADGCEDGIPHPGQYALAVDGVQVWPDDEPTSVLFDGVQYSLDNRVAHVTEACEAYASWRAELDG